MTISAEFMIQMSKTEDRELQNRLFVLIEHLLKLEHVRGQVAVRNLRGWTITVRNQRARLTKLFMDHPGMKSQLTDELVDDTYHAVIADLEEDYPGVAFPGSRQLSLQEILTGAAA